MKLWTSTYCIDVDPTIMFQKDLYILATCLNILIPNYFITFFTCNYRIHSHNTRNKNKLHVPYC